ncbi:TlpA disulfide reductase family protein [Thioclava sp. GXIMD4216]|uniref:TlpA disulfide reductase family protein n=1 Tax=Thioclava sp. GXIMD4216 TaxID=3131929 RepID=UPI0030D0447F
MLRSLVLYTALALGANAAMAAELDPLKTGEMQKLVTYNAPIDLPELEFQDEGGKTHHLSDYRGKVVVVNFWATWCVPCREEMPALEKLQKTIGGKDLAVVTIASGRNPPEKIDRFFADIGVENLPKFTDKSQHAARSLGVLGLPVTLIVNREGQEIARLIGGADWAGTDAQTLLRAVISDPA